MSLPIPKRVNDLPAVDSDEGEENKENSYSNGYKFRPRRVSELPKYDSDSESSIDDLNCGILNESFIENTTASLTSLDNIRAFEEVKHSKDNVIGNSLTFDLKKLKLNDYDYEEDKNFTTPIRIEKFHSPPPAILKDISQCSTNLQSIDFSKCDKNENRLDSKGLIIELAHEPDRKAIKHIVSTIPEPICLNLPLAQSNTFHLKTIPEVIVESEASGSLISQLQRSEKKLPLLFETPFKASEPCNKSQDPNFITPTVKLLHALPVSRRPIYLGSSTRPHKSRSKIENEFRSEKVLFQTPYASSRPPVSSITNNSIKLSFDDTVEKTSTSDTLVPNLFNSKKSSNELFVKATDEEKTTSSQNEKITSINGKKYVLSKKLGSGGSSTVFLAKLKESDLECALKIVDLKGDQSVIDGYINEAKLLAKLQGNVTVVSLYEYEHRQNDSILYMVMEKGDSDLHKTLQSYKTDLPIPILVNFWYQMLQSVNYIHENGIIHSDLKPANFLMVNGRLKLIDFGIASNINVDSTSVIKFSQAGTFNYISPEALTDTSSGNSPRAKERPKIRISKKSDVWSLGCILYLFLYKKTPFGHIKNICAKVSAITSPESLVEYPDLPNYYPPIFIEMVKKCLIFNPKERSSVAELLNFPFEMFIIPLEKDTKIN